uniref:Nicotianamine synthase n=1 Tax=Ananas comosus var. bracteatus TaxID=296719 RepID=A0A6V7PCG3_ANACO|nr:unnamed protein product [Ananas comosus var. bracteatus]
MGNQEEMLVKKITEIYESISKLPDLSPSEEVNALFTELVLACIPASPIDVSKLSNNGEQEMRSNLIRLCGEAEGLLESHYSDLLASNYENPLEHFELFPYYSNYLKLSHLEYSLLARHVPGAPAAARVAFVGSGPLPLSSIVLASRHMRAARFYNYDLSATANAQARRLVRADADVGPRMAFRTVDVMNATREEIAKYEVVFLAALVGIGREEKVRVVAHLAASMAPGAALVVRSAQGARGFLYPVVEMEDLEGSRCWRCTTPTMR